MNENLVDYKRPKTNQLKCFTKYFNFSYLSCVKKMVSSLSIQYSIHYLFKNKTFVAQLIYLLLNSTKKALKMNLNYFQSLFEFESLFEFYDIRILICCKIF